MPTDKEELARRIALARADHLVRGFNFVAVLELVKEHAGAAAANGLQAPLGPRVLPFFNYPAAEFLRLTYAAADLLEPVFRSVDAAFTAMGRAAAWALVDSAAGKMLLRLVRGAPPDVLVRHAPTAYGMAASHVTLAVKDLEQTSAKLELTSDLMPVAFHLGILSAGLEAVGLDACVEGREVGPSSVEFRVRWVPTRTPAARAGV
ncbi:MAG: DUF2378 family protein [Myxococcaceae bacterium]|nr:DUF2378 family protein [Myxococcaceae bacterium]